MSRTTARREAGALVGALLFYALFYAAFFFQSFLTDNYIAPSDSLDFGVAAYLSPPAVWTEWMYSGYPVSADPQTLTWYPVMHLFRVFGAGWNIFLISAYVIASAAAFMLVRRMSGCTLAGIFSGFVCGFSALMIGYITNFNQIHAFAWVPLVLYGLQLIREGLHRSGAAVAAMATALMWLAGHPQVPVYAMYLAAGVVAGSLLIDRPGMKMAITRLRWSGLALAIGLALAAVMLVPMIELGGFTYRAEATLKLYESNSLPPADLMTMFVPLILGGFWTGSGRVPYVGGSGDSAYIGLLPLAFALAAPFVLSRYRSEARLWVALAVLEIFLCLGPVTPIGTLFYYAPGYSSFQAPLRHLFLVSLCLAVAAGLAFAELTRDPARRGSVAVAVSAITVLAAIGFVLFAWRISPIRDLLENYNEFARWALGWPLMLATGLVVFVLLARRFPDSRAGARTFGVLLVAAHTVDLGMLHYRMPGRRFAYADVARRETILHPKMTVLRDELQKTGERILATDGSQNQFLLPNLTRAWSVPAATGTGSLGIRRYVDVLGIGTSGGVSPDTFAPAHHGLDLFAIRYVLVRQNSTLARNLEDQPERWQALENLHYYEDDPDTHYTLFRNLNPLRRAWCVATVVHVNDGQALGSIRSGRLPDDSQFDPSRSALVEAGTLDNWGGGEGPGGDLTVDHASGQNRYVVNASQPCMLVVSEVDYPWWRASLDDKPVDVVRVNHTMVGVAVPPGSHLVRLTMRPVSVWTGAGITAAGLLAWSALVARAVRNRTGRADVAGA